MSDIEDLADSIPNIKGDPCLDGRRKGGLALAKLGGAISAQKRNAAAERGDRLRMSVHTPSLPRLKFLEGEDT